MILLLFLYKICSCDCIHLIFLRMALVCASYYCHRYKNLLTSKTMTYPGRLGDWYTNLGAQILAPKKYFLSFLFVVVYQQK